MNTFFFSPDSLQGSASQVRSGQNNSLETEDKKHFGYNLWIHQKELFFCSSHNELTEPVHSAGGREREATEL